VLRCCVLLASPRFGVDSDRIPCADPNGPFYFNGVFHLFSQCRRMAAAFPIPPGGWCHYASRDLIKWRRLGYALKPDMSYDNISLDTGSATIVDGVPTMLIPGVGKVTDSSVNFSCPSFRVPALRGPCRVRMTFAVPANLSDPWLREWVKPAANNPLIDAPPSDIEPYWHVSNTAHAAHGPPLARITVCLRARLSSLLTTVLRRISLKRGKTTRQADGGRSLALDGEKERKHHVPPVVRVHPSLYVRHPMAASTKLVHGPAKPVMSCGLPRMRRPGLLKLSLLTRAGQVPPSVVRRCTEQLDCHLRTAFSKAC
jgi:hypothetical protein